MYHHPVNFYQVCENVGPGSKMDPHQEPYVLHRFIKEKHKKKSSCLKPHGVVWKMCMKLLKIVAVIKEQMLFKDTSIFNSFGHCFLQTILANLKDDYTTIHLRIMIFPIEKIEQIMEEGC